MSCPQNMDWKAYAIGELGEAEKRSATAHLPTCADCREELVSVQAILNSLSALREEEMPRRIAFLADKVAEPSWWQKLNPMFASASLVAAAIVVHAFVAQPAAAEIPAAVQAQIQQQMEQNNILQDQLMVLDQQNKYQQQALKASMNLVTY